MVYCTTSLTRRLIVESIFIKKCDNMNLCEGFYKGDDIQDELLMNNYHIRSAYNLCKNPND